MAARFALEMAAFTTTPIAPMASASLAMVMERRPLVDYRPRHQNTGIYALWIMQLLIACCG